MSSVAHSGWRTCPRGPNSFMYGLMCDHRCSVEGVESAHGDLAAFDAQEGAGGHPKTVPVGAVLGSLGEDSHLRPVRVTAGTACADFNVVGVDAVEHIHHVDMQ